MSSLTRPAVRRLASALAATTLLTGGFLAGTGTAAASLPVTNVCGGMPPPYCAAEGSGSVAVDLLNVIVGTLQNGS